MRNRYFGSRKGFNLVEVIVVGLFIILVLSVAVWLIFGWAMNKVSVDVVGANRAYEAVAAAQYVRPELVATYDGKDLGTFCHAADDAVGYGMLATPPGGGERNTLTVCCPSATSARECTVRDDSD